MYEFDVNLTSSRFLPLRSHICLFLSLALARTMQKNDRARDDGQKDSVSVRQAPLFYSALTHFLILPVILHYAHSRSQSQRKLEGKKRKYPNLRDWYSTSNTLISHSFHPSPGSPVNNRLYGLACHQRCAQAVYNPPSHFPSPSLTDRFLDSLPNSHRGQSCCAQQEMELR